jgi:spore germination cell wall hydrolase CwlJ-like protein
MIATAALKLRRLGAERPRAMVAGVLGLAVAGALIGVAGSQGPQEEVRVASRAELHRAAFGLSDYAYSTAQRASLGLQGWHPRGIPGYELYDTTMPNLLRRNLSFEEARQFNRLVEATTTPIESLKPFILDASASDAERALHCLTQAIYYEAGFETGEGQQAVAQVILNRLRHPAYPKSVCGVVYQGSQRTTGCQFSFTCDGSLLRPPALAAWERARYVAKSALGGFVYKPVGTATHYHADYVFPYWAPTLVKLRQIGAHIFYRMTGPTGTPDGFGGRYAGNEAYLTAAVLGGGDTLTPDAPSAPAAAAAMPDGPLPMQTVSLTIGGETKTYQVGDAVATAMSPGVAASDGMLTRIRPKATAEQIAAINAKLKSFEEKLDTPSAPKPAVGTE